MASVDNRVVAMKFENDEFESKISKTLASLRSLKEHLSFGAENKNLTDLSKAGNEFSLSGIGRAVEEISSKFSAMSVIAVTALSNITNQAIATGEKIAKALSIQGALDGFREYEIEINSVQTVLANTKSKGTTLDQVNEGLKQLNEYSDKTIYNFGQMTKNVGTFTAAGIELTPAIAAIKGIANLGALGGANPEQVAGGMYQLSQALSAGSLKLQDWNSVVANNLGNETFKISLFETAKAMGTLTDVPMNQTLKEWEASGNNFRLSLEKGWITSDVLTQTLSTFTGDLTKAELISMGYNEAQADRFIEVGKTANDAATIVKTFTGLVGTVKETVGSGWSQTMKLFLGNFKEAQDLFTSLNTVIGGFVSRIANARNSIVSEWKDLGGREALIQTLRNVLWSLATVLGTIHKAFREVFPKKTASDFLILTKRIQEFTKNAIPTQETVEKIGRIFKGIFSVFSIGISIVKAVFHVFSSLFGVFNHFNGGGFVLEFFAKIADKATWLKEVLENGGGLNTFVDKFLGPLVEFVKKLDFGPKIDAIVVTFNRFRDALAEAFGKIDFEKRFKPLVDGFVRLKDAIANFFTSGFSASSEAMGSATERVGLRFESFIKIGEKLGEFFDWIGDKIDVVTDVFKNVFAKIGEALKGGDFQPVKDALNVGLFAGILALVGKFLKDGIPFDIGGGFFRKIGDSFKELTGVFKSMQADIKADALMRIAKAMAILTASLLVLSLINSEALTKAFLAVGLGFAALTHTMKQLDKIAGDGNKAAVRIAVLSGALIGLAVAIGILSLGVFVLSKIDSKELDKGLTAITILILGVGAAIKLMGDPQEMGKTGLGLLGLAVSLGILIGVIVILAKIDSDILVKGMLALGVLLAELTISIHNIPDDTGVKATEILGFALALLILTQVVRVFGEMDLNTMVQGLLGVGLMLTLITVALKNMPDDLPKMAVSLIAVSAAVYALSYAVKAFAEMDPIRMGLAIGGIAAALVVLALGTRILADQADGILAIGAIAVALVALGAAFTIFEKLGLAGIAVGLIAIVATFLIVSLAAVALQAAIPFIAGFGTALMLVGQAMLLVGLSVLVFAAGIGVLVLSIIQLSKIGGEGLNEFLKVLPKLTVGLVQALLLALMTFAQGLQPVVEEFTKLGITILAAINTLIPKVQEVFGNVLAAIIKTISDNIQAISDLGFKVLLALLTGIAENIGMIVIAAGKIIVDFLTALSVKQPEIIDAGVKLLVDFISGLTKNIDSIVEAVDKLIEQFLLSIGKQERIDRIVAAGGTLVSNLISGFTTYITQYLVPAILDFVTRLATEVVTRDNVQKLVDAGFTVALNLLNGIADAIDNNAEEMGRAMGRLAGALIKGIVHGIRGGGEEVRNAIKDLVKEMLDTFGLGFLISSPSKVMIKMGGYIAEGVGIGLQRNTTAVESASQFGSDILTSINGALTQAALGVENMGEFNPTIAPVIDMTNIEKGASRMSTLMNDPSLTPVVSFNQATSLSAATSAQDQLNSEQSQPPSVVKEIKFEQNLYSPSALNASEIYRQHRSQLSFAKEELDNLLQLTT